MRGDRYGMLNIDVDADATMSNVSKANCQRDLQIKRNCGTILPLPPKLLHHIGLRRSRVFGRFWSIFGSVQFGSVWGEWVGVVGFLLEYMGVLLWIVKGWGGIVGCGRIE